MSSAPPIGSPGPDELLKRVACSDREAFVLLFEYFAPRVVTYLIRGGTSPAAAEELAQEAMLQVWRKARSFDTSRGAASTWIYTIARNLRNDRWRLRENSDIAFDGELNDVIADEASPEERASGRELHDRLHTALEDLSADHARLLRLCYLSERPQAEVAREFALPLATIKSRIRVALGHLRRVLESDRP